MPLPLNKGDRVVALKDKRYPNVENLHGTIIDTYKPPKHHVYDYLIEFDQSFRGGHNGDNKGKQHHCFNLPNSCVIVEHAPTNKASTNNLTALQKLIKK